jgi:Tol biopolymer transport system component/DNA-binding winged helix-turn-helix (wHTH) protein
MASTRPAPDVVRFGGFELDLRTGELARDHLRVLLPDQPFRLLALLIRERGTLVTRDTLRHELWSDDTYVGFEAGLNAAIKRLREILGDAAASPTFIETLPRRGYRFIAPVEPRPAPGQVEESARRETAAAAVVVPTVPEASAEGRAGRPWYPALAVGLIAVGAALVAIMALRTRTPASRGDEGPRQPGMRRVTNLGTVRRAFVSPDGNDLVYARDEGAQQSLWIRRGRTADPVRILGPVSGSFESLSLSPEGMVYYAFFSADRSDRSLHRLPTGGGRPELVLEAAGAIAFSPDGSRYAYVQNTSMTLRESRVVLVEARSGQSRVLSTRKTPESYGNLEPAWSTDGSRLTLLGSSDAEPGRHQVIDVDVQSGLTRRVADLALAEVMGALWRPDGRELVVSGRERRATPLRLWSVSAGSGGMRPLTTDVSDYTPVGWGGTTDEMLVIRRETLRSLWSAEASAPDRVRLVAQDAGSLHGFDAVAWGAQGELLYTLTDSDNADIWGIETKTLGRRRLTTDPADDYEPCVSPDGETVVFASNRGGLPGLWAMARDGSQPRRLTTGGDAYPSFSPDGTWVAFQRSGVWSTPWAVYRVFLRTGDVEQLTVSSTMRPAVSPDGRFVAHYWMTPERWAMAVTPVEGGVPTRIFGLRPTHAERYIRWAPDGTALAYLDLASGASNLWLQPLPEGPPRMLTSFTEGSIATFDWSRDGASLAFMRVTEVADVVAIDLSPSPRP